MSVLKAQQSIFLFYFMSTNKETDFNFSNTGFTFSNLAELVQPGLYMIKCLENGRMYIGQTQNLLERLGKHSATLIKQNADCADLQEDWQKYGQSSFEIQLLAIGERYATAAARISEEQTLIKNAVDQGLPLYNQLTQRTGKRNIRQPVKIKGVTYYSINEAIRELNIPNTTLRRYLLNPKMTEYETLEPQEVGYSTVSVNGIVYNGVVDVVEAGLAKDSFEALRRLKAKSKRWKDWFYIDRACDHRGKKGNQ